MLVMRGSEQMATRSDSGYAMASVLRIKMTVSG